MPDPIDNVSTKTNWATPVEVNASKNEQKADASAAASASSTTAKDGAEKMDEAITATPSSAFSAMIAKAEHLMMPATEKGAKIAKAKEEEKDCKDAVLKVGLYGTAGYFVAGAAIVTRSPLVMTAAGASGLAHGAVGSSIIAPLVCEQKEMK